MNIILVGLGGMIGAILRFFFLSIDNGALWIINGGGSFGLGLLNGYLLQMKGKYERFRLFIGTGLLGAFTTFSTFSSEWFEVMKESIITGILYALTMTAMCILLSYLGARLGRTWSER